MLGFAVLPATAVLLAGCGGGARSTPAPFSPPRLGHLPAARTTPLRSIFQADVPLHRDPAGTLDILRALGADTVRMTMPWGATASGSLAPDPGAARPPSGFDATNPADYPAAGWAVYDTIIRAAQKRGMTIDLTFAPPPPLWARGAGDPGTGTQANPLHPQWRLNARRFGQWVRAVGRRYSGHYRDATGTVLPRVGLWGIWNEPNFGPMLAPQTVKGVDASPALYRRMVDQAYSALRSTGHGGDTILIGELAPYGVSTGRGPRAFGYMVPLRFLRSLYCVGPKLTPLSGTTATALGCPPSGPPSGFRAAHPGLFAASALALHPYTQGPPAVSTPGEPDYANLPQIPRVEATIDAIFAAYGASRRLPLWSTEFGVHTNPPETIYAISPAAAAVYLNQSEYLSWLDPRLRSYDQYLLSDGPTGVFATGLVFADGRPKPGLAAYRMPLYLPYERRHGTVPLEVWGAVRPARYATRSLQRVAIEFRRAGTSAFRAVRTVSLAPRSVYFDVLQRFDDAGSLRTAWRAPDGKTLYSRIAHIT